MMISGFSHVSKTPNELGSGVRELVLELERQNYRDSGQRLRRRCCWGGMASSRHAPKAMIMAAVLNSNSSLGGTPGKKLLRFTDKDRGRCYSNQTSSGQERNGSRDESIEGFRVSRPIACARRRAMAVCRPRSKAYVGRDLENEDPECKAIAVHEMNQKVRKNQCDGSRRQPAHHIGCSIFEHKCA